jgi:hypothetical protein
MMAVQLLPSMKHAEISERTKSSAGKQVKARGVAPLAAPHQRSAPPSVWPSHPRPRPTSTLERVGPIVRDIIIAVWRTTPCSDIAAALQARGSGHTTRQYQLGERLTGVQPSQTHLRSKTMAKKIDTGKVIIGSSYELLTPELTCCACSVPCCHGHTRLRLEQLQLPT